MSLDVAWRRARETAVAVDLTGRTVLVLAGPDARRFANGMFTQNLRDLPVGAASRSAWCDDRGRLLGLMDVYVTAEDAFVLVPEGTAFEDFEARFAKFVLFDDVEMSDHTAEVGLVTVQGPSAAAAVRAAGFALPEDGWLGVAPCGVGRRDRSGLGGFDLLVERGQVASVLGTLAEGGTTVAPADVLDLLRVEAGRAAWPADMDERTFPHEVGLRDEVLHFGKGCYVGQEIINRMDTFAKVRRTLVTLAVQGTPPPDGAEVSIDGTVVGRLTSPVHSPEHGTLGLCVIRKPHDAPGTRVEVVAHGETWRAEVRDAGE